MTVSFDQFNVAAVARFGEKEPQTIRLFRREEVIGVLLCFEPGQTLPQTADRTAHAAFDVISGSGTITVGDIPVSTYPGKTVFVAAGTPYGLANTSDVRWVVRMTSHRRLSPRHIGQLLVREVRKRLGLEPR